MRRFSRQRPWRRPRDLAAGRQALSISEAQLRLFVDQAPFGIAMFDSEMRYVAASRRWIDTYGRGQTQLIGMSHYALHPDLPERWKDIHRRTLNGEVQECTEDLWTPADGSQNWIHWAARPWVDKNGAIGGIILFAEDITPRKRAAELLHTQQQQIALMTRNIPGLLALLDNQYRYLFVNERFAESVGRSVAEIIGMRLEAVIGPAAFERAQPYMERVLLGEQVTYENSVINAAGKTVYVQLTVAPQLSTDGQMSSFIVVGTDITPLKDAERALREANEALERRVCDRTAALAAANKELESFSYSVSHDLRAPLRAIDGFSRILLESFAEELSAEAQEYLKDIRTNTQQMGRLVDDLLALARLGRQTIHRQSIDTTSLVQAILRSLQAAQPNRRIETHIGELLPCSADPGLLKQVWQNLLHNATKYTARPDSTIVATIVIGCQVDKSPPVYYVRDNGVGFDMHYAHKLFGVFSRLHRAEDYEGTGVGLAIVKRIVERHGGRVWAEAEPERGATFFFTLPNPQESSHHDG